MREAGDSVGQEHLHRSAALAVGSLSQRLRLSEGAVKEERVRGLIALMPTGNKLVFR